MKLQYHINSVNHPEKKDKVLSFRVPESELQSMMELLPRGVSLSPSQAARQIVEEAIRAKRMLALGVESSLIHVE